MNKCDACAETFNQFAAKYDRLKFENTFLRNENRNLNSKNMIVKKTFYNAIMSSENPYVGSKGEYALTYVFTGSSKDLQKVAKIFDKIMGR